MKQVSEFLLNMIPIILFCAAVTLCFLHFKSLSKSYQCIKESVIQNDVFYETSCLSEKDMISKQECVTKKDLIITLVSRFSYDIEIDGNLYLANTFDYSTFDFSSLRDCYNKYYRYDEKGAIVSVCYLKMEDGK